jgi:hypothetical protein
MSGRLTDASLPATYRWPPTHEVLRSTLESLRIGGALESLPDWSPGAPRPSLVLHAVRTRTNTAATANALSACVARRIDFMATTLRPDV